MKTCQYCGFKSKSWMSRNREGWYCSAEIACFNRILLQMRSAQSLVKRMRHVGAQMANACFNLSQADGLHSDDKSILNSLREQWDRAVKP